MLKLNTPCLGFNPQHFGEDQHPEFYVCSGNMQPFFVRWYLRVQADRGVGWGVHMQKCVYSVWNWNTLLVTKALSFFLECVDENSTSMITLKHRAAPHSGYMRTQKGCKQIIGPAGCMWNYLSFCLFISMSNPFMVYVDRILRRLAGEDGRSVHASLHLKSKFISFLGRPLPSWMTSKWADSHLSFCWDSELLLYMCR